MPCAVILSALISKGSALHLYLADLHEEAYFYGTFSSYIPS